jgi:hypothetical protein
MLAKADIIGCTTMETAPKPAVVEDNYENSSQACRVYFNIWFLHFNKFMQ